MPAIVYLLWLLSTGISSYFAVTLLENLLFLSCSHQAVDWFFWESMALLLEILSFNYSIILKKIICRLEIAKTMY